MNGIRTLLLASFAALCLPVSALAQMTPGQGPPPEMRAQMEKLRADAKTASYNDLSADHRAKVQAIVAQYNSGSLTMQDATSQIDAILTPDESKAVLGEQQKMRDAMRQAFSNGNSGYSGGGGYSGSGGNSGYGNGGHGGYGGHRQPDAGRFLLMVSASPGSFHPNPQSSP